MSDRLRPTALLPRLVPGDGRAAVACNAGGLCGAALAGAGLVHLLAYHALPGLPLSPHWGATALSLLAHCPLRGPLGLIAAMAVLAPLLALREVLRLRRLSAALGAAMRARRATQAPASVVAPRSLGRLAGFVALVLGLQAALLHLFGLLCPMQATMVMGGVPMTMALAPALPLGLLQVVLAILCALALWRLECRLIRLRAEVARGMSLLNTRDERRTSCLPASRAVRSLLGWYGYTLFARPPPFTA